MRITSIQLFLICLVLGCQDRSAQNSNSFPAPDPPRPIASEEWPESLKREVYHDKVLGLLVGSAIGDAMGAPVEMWGREQMIVQYGFISDLLNVRREGSPEGPWEDNLAAGGTTDDTRWKFLFAQFMLENESLDTIRPDQFAQFIIDIYENEKEQVSDVRSFEPEPMEREITHMAWLQEWARVSRPYLENDIQGYSYALNRFYGGEMACAGMLYSPMVGVFFPGQANEAYIQAYGVGLFDLGYARDVMALTSSYVAEAMDPDCDYQRLKRLSETVDPMRYFNSRLVGRLADNSSSIARQIVYDINGLKEEDIDPDLRIPSNYKGTNLEYYKLTEAFDMLDDHLQMIPFHAGEIHLINLVALEYSDGNFQKAMEFVVNFGRDNDTVGAVTGAILGAFHGYSGLPESLSKKVLDVSRNEIKIDLEKLAQDITNKVFGPA